MLIASDQLTAFDWLVVLGLFAMIFGSLAAAAAIYEWRERRRTRRDLRPGYIVGGFDRREP